VYCRVRRLRAGLPVFFSFFFLPPPFFPPINQSFISIAENPHPRRPLAANLGRLDRNKLIRSNKGRSPSKFPSSAIAVDLTIFQIEPSDSENQR
jgi:hypothetical protein